MKLEELTYAQTVDPTHPENLALLSMSNNRWMVARPPLFSEEYAYGDVVEVQDGKVVKLLESPGWSTYGILTASSGQTFLSWLKKVESFDVVVAEYTDGVTTLAVSKDSRKEVYDMLKAGADADIWTPFAILERE